MLVSPVRQGSAVDACGMILRCLFPYERQEYEVPFVQMRCKCKADCHHFVSICNIHALDNGGVAWCYEHQTSIVVRLRQVDVAKPEYEFEIGWLDRESQNADAQEQAICVLHPQFKWVADTR